MLEDPDGRALCIRKIGCVHRQLSRYRPNVQFCIKLLEGRLRLTVVDSGVGFVLETHADGIASIRDRLFALYGDGARLVFGKQVAGPTEAVLEIPYEPIDTPTATVG